MDKERIIRIASGKEFVTPNVMFDVVNAWHKASGREVLPQQMNGNELHELMNHAMQYWLGIHSVHIVRDKNNNVLKIF